MPTEQTQDAGPKRDATTFNDDALPPLPETREERQQRMTAELANRPRPTNACSEAIDRANLDVRCQDERDCRRVIDRSARLATSCSGSKVNASCQMRGPPVVGARGVPRFCVFSWVDPRGCSPPFDVDLQGHRLYRTGCLCTDCPTYEVTDGGIAP